MSIFTEWTYFHAKSTFAWKKWGFLIQILISKIKSKIFTSEIILLIRTLRKPEECSRKCFVQNLRKEKFLIIYFYNFKTTLIILCPKIWLAGRLRSFWKGERKCLEKETTKFGEMETAVVWCWCHFPNVRKVRSCFCWKKEEKKQELEEEESHGKKKAIDRF